LKKRAEKEGGKKKEMITVEVKNGSASRATATGYGDLMRKRRRHHSLQMRLGRRQKQESLDRCLVKVTQKEKDSTDSSDSVSDNESRPTQ
jgi:mevalonate pyrophosphate decarboxylase